MPILRRSVVQFCSAPLVRFHTALDTPSPFVDTIGIVAGRLGYPLRSFLAYSIVGKVIQSIAFVYLALWNISLVSSWTGLGT